MATGRIGVTPVLRTRWSDQPTVGTTSLSGLDDNSVSLVYDVGYEAVYRNGVLLSRGNDYTATDGTTVTLIDATLAGDIIEIFANELVPLTDAISKGQYNAKGALLSATAASTPGVLAVGANDTVLTADSAEATGLKWATPAAGGMTLLSTTTLSGATTTVSSISGAYNNLQIVMYGMTNATGGGKLRIAPNGSTTISSQINLANTTGIQTVLDSYILPYGAVSSATNTESNQIVFINIIAYSNTSFAKPFETYGRVNDTTGYPIFSNGYINTTSAITSLVFSNDGGSWTAGTVLIYGVK
jgi:hypothetical protein